MLGFLCLDILQNTVQVFLYARQMTLTDFLLPSCACAIACLRESDDLEGVCDLGCKNLFVHRGPVSTCLFFLLSDI